MIYVDEIIGTNAYIDGVLQPKKEGETYRVRDRGEARETMSENPDNQTYLGLGPQSKIVTDDGEELDMDSRYLGAVQHQLRFIKRDGSAVLQQYQWSQELGRFDWFDIPLVDEEFTLSEVG